jgi:hypothetical protein
VRSASSFAIDRQLQSFESQIESESDTIDYADMTIQQPFITWADIEVAIKETSSARPEISRLSRIKRHVKSLRGALSRRLRGLRQSVSSNQAGRDGDITISVGRSEAEGRSFDEIMDVSEQRDVNATKPTDVLEEHPTARSYGPGVNIGGSIMF